MVIEWNSCVYSNKYIFPSLPNGLVCRGSLSPFNLVMADYVGPISTSGRILCILARHPFKDRYTLACGTVPPFYVRYNTLGFCLPMIGGV